MVIVQLIPTYSAERVLCINVREGQTLLQDMTESFYTSMSVLLEL